MGVNPFEPPRSTEQAPEAVGGKEVLAEAALAELIAGAPWARWAARLTLLGAAVGLVNAIVSYARSAKTPDAVGALAGGPISIIIALVFFFVFRRYAQHAERLSNRQPEELAEALDAQRAIFKAYGVLAIIGMGFVVLGLTAAIVIAIYLRSR